jgi:iron complex outermembrane receptor protein
MYASTKSWSFLSAIAVVVVAMPNAHAQSAGADKLEEIVVTAERVEENLQKTSISVATVSGEEISQQGNTNVESILKNVPGVVVVGSARGQTVSIRGIGFDLPPQVGENPVSMNNDGIYNFRSEGGTYGFFDLARVEVLRGPQGTLYGRNATAGVVNMISNAPGREFAARGVLESGNYHLLRAEGAVNVPLSDSWAARVAFVTMNRNGYLSNGQNDAVGSGGRARALYSPNDSFSLMLNAEYSKIGGKGPGSANGTQFDAGNELVGVNSSAVSNSYESTRYWAQLDADAGPGKVTFIPSYQWAQGYNYADGMGMGPQPAGTVADCAGNYVVAVGSIVCRSNDPVKAQQTSNELRYGNQEGAFKWVTGLYFYNKTDKGEAMGAGGASPPTLENKTRSQAVFGQITAPLADAIRLIAGVRESRDKKSFAQKTAAGVVQGKGEFSRSAFDWKLGLELDAAEQSMLYTTLATGHRPGGFNSFIDPTAPTFGTKFDSESVISFEVGSKNRFLEDRLQLNGAVYYYDYQDFQAADVWFNQNGLNANFQNVGKVKNYGAELEARALIGQGGEFNLGVNYVHARYDSSLLLTPTGPGAPVQMKGKAITHAPDWSVKAGYAYTFDLGDSGSFTARAEGRYTGEQYVNLFPSVANFQEAYTTGDVSLSYNSSSDKWNLNTYLKNVNNKIVKQAAFGDYIVSSPRTWGVVFSAKM